MNIQGYGTIFRRTSKRNNEYWVLRMKQKDKSGEEKWYGMLVRYNKNLDSILRGGTSFIDENGNRQEKSMNIFVQQGWIKFWKAESGNINPYLFINEIKYEDLEHTEFQDDTNPFENEGDAPIQTVEYPPVADNFEQPAAAAVDMTTQSHTEPIMDDGASDRMKQFRQDNISNQ